MYFHTQVYHYFNSLNYYITKNVVIVCLATNKLQTQTQQLQFYVMVVSAFETWSALVLLARYVRGKIDKNIIWF